MAKSKPAKQQSNASARRAVAGKTRDAQARKRAQKAAK
jgi:hypothetical protein